MSERPPVTPQPTYANAHSNLKDQDTPFSHKLASTDACPHRLLTHAVMDPALKEELHESELIDVPGLIEHLFPDAILPLPVDFFASKILGNQRFEKHSHWNPTTMTWLDFPDLKLYDSVGKAERKLASFLNAIGSSLRSICLDSKAGDRIPAKPRKWRVRNSTKPLTGGPGALRKPDLTLDDHNLPTWASVLSIAELKSNPADVGTALDQLTSSAYMIFSTQDGRCFNIGVSFCAFMVRVYVFDRSGIVGSKPFDPRRKPELLIRLMAGLILASKSTIGFDPTIIHKNGKRFIIIQNKTYELLERLFISRVIRGRGTVCWRGHHDGIDYIIKDLWADTSRNHTEAEIMAAAVGVEGIPKLLAEEMVMRTMDEADSTAFPRNIIKRKTYPLKDWLAKLEIRIHRRLLTSPCALGISHFSSQRELLSVLIDAIEAHQGLYNNGILHRDVNLNHIMIRSAKESVTSPSTSSYSVKSKTSVRRGLLIDLDYSTFLSEDERDVAVAHRTGSVPFMALELLINSTKKTKHTLRHDLESFFYVLFWICCHYVGPNNAERQNFDILLNEYTQPWLSGKVKGMGLSKSGFFEKPSTFDEALFIIAPYFRNFMPCLRALRSLVFQQTTQHEDLIKLLKSTLDELPEKEDWSESNDELGYGKVSVKAVKRSRDDILPAVQEKDETNSDNETDHPNKRTRSDQVAVVGPAIRSHAMTLRARQNTISR